MESIKNIDYFHNHKHGNEVAKDIQKEIKTKTISVKILESVYRNLKTKTAEDGITTSKFLSSAVDDYLNDHMKLNKKTAHFTYGDGE